MSTTPKVTPTVLRATGQTLSVPVAAGHPAVGQTAKSPPGQAGATLEAGWSLCKIRSVAGLLIALMAAGIPLLQSPEEPVRIVGLIWCGLLALPLVDLLRRALDRAPVLRIDAHGILDRRIAARTIGWWEIDAFTPVDREHGRVVELRLRHPEITLPYRGRLRRMLWTQVDAHLHHIGLPDACISLLLLDLAPRDVLRAVSRLRPDLLPRD